MVSLSPSAQSTFSRRCQNPRRIKIRHILIKRPKCVPLGDASCNITQTWLAKRSREATSSLMMAKHASTRDTPLAQRQKHIRIHVVQDPTWRAQNHIMWELAPVECCKGKKVLLSADDVADASCKTTPPSKRGGWPRRRDAPQLVLKTKSCP